MATCSFVQSFLRLLLLLLFTVVLNSKVICLHRTCLDSGVTLKWPVAPVKCHQAANVTTMTAMVMVATKPMVKVDFASLTH